MGKKMSCKGEEEGSRERRRGQREEECTRGGKGPSRLPQTAVYLQATPDCSPMKQMSGTQC